MKVSCQCKNITFETPTASPLELYHCHCLACQAQSGSAFGTSAIFPAAGLFPLQEPLKSRLHVWTRATDSDGGTLHCYFCPVCGVRVMHFKEGGDAVSIKGGCIEGLQWRGAVHTWCKRAVVEIPQGAIRWDGEPLDESEAAGQTK